MHISGVGAQSESEERERGGGGSRHGQQEVHRAQVKAQEVPQAENRQRIPCQHTLPNPDRPFPRRRPPRRAHTPHSAAAPQWCQLGPHWQGWCSQRKACQRTPRPMQHAQGIHGHNTDRRMSIGNTRLKTYSVLEALAGGGGTRVSVTSGEREGRGTWSAAPASWPLCVWGLTQWHWHAQGHQRVCRHVEHRDVDRDARHWPALVRQHLKAGDTDQGLPQTGGVGRDGGERCGASLHHSNQTAPHTRARPRRAHTHAHTRTSRMDTRTSLGGPAGSAVRVLVRKVFARESPQGSSCLGGIKSVCVSYLYKPAASTAQGTYHHRVAFRRHHDGKHHEDEHGGEDEDG